MKKGQIQSNPFGFSSNNFSNEEADNSWGQSIGFDEDETNQLTNNQNNSNDFFNQQKQQGQQKGAKQTSHIPFQNSNQQNQPSHNPFDMQGMIDLNNPQANNQNQQQTDQFSQQPNQQQQSYGDDIEDEPPLLEDLGINLELIKERVLCVLKMTKCDERFLLESDMSGPILIGFTLGCLLMLSGKIHFGYIYGFSICGTICLYFVLNLLSQHRQVALYNTFSILGYCLIPIVGVAVFAIVLNLNSIFGFIISSIAILWATYVASTFFEEVLELNHQKYLAAYPILLFYSTFVLITVF